jgi:hypothetical protein
MSHSGPSLRLLLRVLELEVLVQALDSLALEVRLVFVLAQT